LSLPPPPPYEGDFIEFVLALGLCCPSLEALDVSGYLLVTPAASSDA
jgi:hypothetical protein